MNLQQPSTFSQQLAKVFAANASGSSITAPTPTTTEPTGDGVFESILAEGTVALNALWLIFYGTRSSADNETFTARVTGWKKVTTLWVPIPLLALALTQGTSTGVAAAEVIATEYFADTITASTAFTSAYEIISPADNTIAAVKVDFAGCRKVQVQLAKGTNATCNVLAAGF